MRVEGYQKVAQVYTGKNEIKATESTQKKGHDQLEISQSGRDYQIARQAIADIEDVRTDKIEGIKDRIQNDSYHVSGDDFAAKVIAKYNQHIF